MKVLVINSGSSSLKYQLIDMQTEDVIAKGTCERIGIDGSNFENGKNNIKNEEPKLEEEPKVEDKKIEEPQLKKDNKVKNNESEGNLDNE